MSSPGTEPGVDEVEGPDRACAPDLLTCGLAGALAGALVIARLVMTGNPFDQVWAEDGAVFLARGDTAAGLVESYAGYGLLVPRLLAACGAALPVAWWAAFAVLAAALVVGCAAATAWFVAALTTRSTAAAWVASTSFAVLPAERLETLGSLANLQWFLVAACAWVFWLPAARARTVAAVVAACAAGTTPLVVLVLPILLARHGRRVLRAPAAWGAGAGLLYQGGVVLLGPVSPGGPVRDPGLPPRAVGTFLDHLGGTGNRLPAAGLVFGLCLFVLVVIGLVRGGDDRPLVGLTLAAGVLLVVALSVLSGAVASRYVAGGVLLVSVGASIGTSVGSRLAGAAVAVAAVVAVVAAPADTIKFVGPSWDAGVQAWRTECAAGAASAAIPVSPPDWGVAQVDCSHY